MKEKSCSSLSKSMKHSDRYTKYDDDEHKRKDEIEQKVYARSKKKYSSDSESSSGSDSDYDSKRFRQNKEQSKKNKYDDYKRERRTYKDVKIKDEPISDNDSDLRSNRQHKSDGRSRFDNERTKRSRWNNSNQDGDNGFPASNKRFKEEEKEPRWGKAGEGAGGDKKMPTPNVAKPDFGLSGKLAEETNTYNGVVIKYSEPPEARKPKRRWRLYPFKGDEGLPALYIHRQSAYLIGRDRKVADLPIDHPSCSKQHAALQYRLVPFQDGDGRVGKKICLYIIDLESANGTFVNNAKIEPKKYVQLLEKDVIKFAFSSREYVLLHEHSKDSDGDDDV